jgi:hypothetical protein
MIRLRTNTPAVHQRVTSATVFSQPGWVCLDFFDDDPHMETMREEWYELPREECHVDQRFDELAEPGKRDPAAGRAPPPPASRGSRRDTGRLPLAARTLGWWNTSPAHQKPPIQTDQTYALTVAGARVQLRSRVEAILTGNTMSRFWTNADLAAALALLDYFERADTFEQLVGTVERAAHALGQLHSHGEAFPPHRARPWPVETAVANVGR